MNRYLFCQMGSAPFSVALHITEGFPCSSVGKKLQSLQCRRPGFDPWIRKILKKEMATHSSILAWRIPWARAWRATVLGSQESDTT